MKLYSKTDDYTIYEGNMLDMLDEIKPNSIDSIVTDPPYELGFMGKSWDKSGVAFQPDTWEKCLEVLKPGGYLLAFGGTRTYHRIACAIEDAGFEIRDCILWIFGSGFPKSMNIAKSVEAKLTTGSGNKKDFYKCNGKISISGGKGYTSMKATNVEQNFRKFNYKSNGYLELEPTTELAKKWQGWGTQLKPAYEPIIVARKPFKGSLVDNVLKNGVGGINIDECRVLTNGEAIAKNVDYKDEKQSEGWGTKKCITEARSDIGRFPANVIHDGSEEATAGMPNTKSPKTEPYIKKSARQEEGVFNSKNSGLKDRVVNCSYGDQGSASRYFYCAKASKRDRDEGLDSLDNKVKVFNGKSANSSTNMKDVEKRFTTVCKNVHPTVKPTSLMQYLVRLVTPKGGVILDPFMGSGSTGKAAMFENKDRNAGYKFVGIELTDEYLPIAKARINFARKEKND